MTQLRSHPVPKCQGWGLSKFVSHAWSCHAKLAPKGDLAASNQNKLVGDFSVISGPLRGCQQALVGEMLSAKHVMLKGSYSWFSVSEHECFALLDA